MLTDTISIANEIPEHNMILINTINNYCQKKWLIRTQALTCM